MNALWPWVALVLTTFAVFAHVRSLPTVPKWGWSRLAPGMAAAVLAVVAGLGPAMPWREPLVALFVGLAASLLLFDLPAGDSLAGRVASIGVAAVLLAVFFRETVTTPGVIFGFLAGVGGGAAVAALVSGSWSSSDTATALSIGAFASLLGAAGPGDKAAATGAVLLFGGLVAGLVGWALGLFVRSWPSWAPGLFAAAAFTGAGVFLGQRYFFMGDIAVLVAVGALAALVTGVVLGGEGPAPRAWAFGLSAVVWLGVATVAFSFRQGYGMAVCGLSGAIVALLLGQRGVLAAMAPIVALAAMRALRETLPDATRAFDIGQHYALIGLILGPTVLLTGLAWARDTAHRRDWLPTALVGAVAAATAVIGVMFLGDKGSIGLVVGFALAPALAGMVGLSAPGAAAAGTGLACASLASLTALGGSGEIGRDMKVTLLVGSAVVAALLLGTAWALSRRDERSPA
ncbi:MAG: hypothetical protein KF884_05770 [Fimbriimonadaceae bacterium]|nr:hypothetical protein [Fimbriimonadaceae bacterium]QYK59593.1 MAG: hypothetical protein KF884_05770 [Fimbriimonadaceae bacterium]